MPQNIPFTDTLIEYLEAIHSEVAYMPGTRYGIFPPPGPLTVPFASSKATRALARKQSIAVVDKTILFVVNSEPDLGRVFAEVRALASELNSIKKRLTKRLVDALKEWEPAPETSSSAIGRENPHSLEFLDWGDEHGFEKASVFDRHIALTPSLLQGLRLLNAALSRWSPAKFGIFAPAGPLTVVIEGSDVLRILARKLDLPTTTEGVVLFITNEISAANALNDIQQLNKEIATVVEAIPPLLKKVKSRR